MEFDIIGKPRKLSISDAIEAVDLFVNKLVGVEKSEEIYLKLEFTYNLRKKSGCGASMDWIDRPVFPVRFHIQCDNMLSTSQTLHHLAHECVHVKQMVIGELKDYYPIGGLKKKWNNKVFDFNFAPDIEAEAYYDLPWEIDANGREQGLVDRYYRLKESVSKID